MAITINGTGTITGISAGGLPDGSVVAADLASSLDLTGKTVTLPSGVGGKFDTYAVICDQKASTADGGTFTSGAWRTRDLNTEISDADSIVSIASNQFTLAAGSYLIRWSAPAYRVLYHQSRLYDVTNTAVIQLGSSAYNSSSSSAQGNSSGSARVVIAASTTYEIQHRSDGTQSTFGFGVGFSGNAFDNTIWTVVEIFKEA